MEGIMQNYWEMISKKNYEVSNYWDMFCRNTEKCSGKIPIRGLRQYWKVFGKNTERCPIKILRCVQLKCWKVLFKIREGSFTFWHTINNIHVKTQGLGSVSVYITAFYFRRPKDNKQLFSPNAEKCGPEKTPYLDTFHVVMKKVIQEIVGVMIFKYEEI